MTREETMAAFQRVAEHCKVRYAHRLPGLRKHWARARGGENLDAFARQLLEAFRLPPFENALEVRRPGLGCPSCGRQNLQAAPRTVAVIEDVARFVCHCGLEWLEVMETNG